jgi:hypothetical protein
MQMGSDGLKKKAAAVGFQKQIKETPSSMTKETFLQ